MIENALLRINGLLDQLLEEKREQEVEVEKLLFVYNQNCCEDVVIAGEVDN